VRLATRLTLGPSFSEGARLLWQAVERPSLGSPEALAQRVGFPNASYLAAHLYGDKVPGPDARARYRRHLKIPLGAWDKAPIVPFQLRALTVLCERALPILAVAGEHGVELPAFALACRFAPTTGETEAVADLVLGALWSRGLAERVGERWRSVPGAGGVAA